MLKAHVELTQCDLVSDSMLTPDVAIMPLPTSLGSFDPQWVGASIK